MIARRAIIVLGAAVALATLAPTVLGAYQLTVALNLCMWIALTQSWTILAGLTGYVSLGHVVFYGLGAYITVLTWQTVPLYMSVPLAGLLTGVFALLIGGPVLRVRGPYFVILTFGIAELVKYSIIYIESALGQFSRLLFGAPGTAQIYYVMLGFAALATLITLSVRRSRFGRGLLAIREDETAAETIGVPVARYKMTAYALSAVIPGMVGAVMVLRSTYFETQQVFNPVISFTIVTMAVIGGSDDARGPILGAVFLVLLSEMLWANAPQFYMVILGALLVGFVLFAPHGIIGVLRSRRARA